MLSISFAGVKTPKNPNSAKGCAICHYRWIDTFFVDGKGSDLVEYHWEKVVATPEMCISCHDGSVMDSRARVNNDSGHKTNMKPPGHMEIPAIFPLDEDGEVQCSTCHTAHAVPSGPDKDTIFLRTSNRDSNMCHMCHPGMNGGLDEGHHPVGIVNREIAPNLISLGVHTGKKTSQIICETCHTAHGSPYESFLVDGAGNSGLCLACHRDKEIFTPDGQRKPFHVLNVAPQNAKIPEELVKKGAKLGYNGVITCLTCHKVHNNKVEQQSLLIKKDEKSALCLTCHVDKNHLTQTNHNLYRSAPMEKNLEGKTAAEAGICSACHLPHKAARKLSGKDDFTTQLCLSCHSKGNVAEKVMISGHSHPVNVNPHEKIKALTGVKKNLTLPLFNAAGTPDKNGKMTCATCHDPHGSRASSAKATSKKDQKTADNAGVFLRDHPQQICKECHLDKILIANSKHNLNKTAPDAKNVLGKTPSETGTCGSCHLVHNAPNRFLWAREANTQSDNLVREICTSCHNEQGLANNKVIKNYSHPVNVSLFEKGLTTTLPLFDKNGEKSHNGAVTCLTCHEPHRWDPVKTVIADHYDVEGNAQNSFLRLETSPSPKLCENCHANKAYVEKTDHDLMVTAPFSKNIIGQTPAESGVCGVCHLVHNSSSWIRLWAQGFATGDSLMNMMCNSCHSANGSAKNKIPQISSHPAGQHVTNVGKRDKGDVDYFPLFHKNYGEPATSANISCPSCHNVHQWNAGSNAKGQSVNIEGNATNSFLRARSSIRPCKDCHGPDALIRYKYFHKSDARKSKSLRIDSPNPF
jgi:predicted CXXCH cytochrome family protein